MSCVSNSGTGCGSSSASNCPDCYGCDGRCPDFEINRNDTKPPFRVSIEDENGPIDLTGLVIEANMWANAKLKKNITALDVSLSLADNVGFCQVLENDVILMDRSRGQEQMRITGFDEENNLIFVERGYNGTVPQEWKRGQSMKIFRIINAPATSELIYEDIMNVDGTTDCNVLSESLLVYEWNVTNTCVPGCFSFEFKVIKMSTSPVVIPSVIPDCFLGIGVEWMQRYPSGCNPFLIKICNTPTMEVTIPSSTT